MQRFFDVSLSGLALIVLSPLLISVIIFLRFTGEGEIFYFQERVGKGGRLFQLCKLATMLKDSPNMGSGTVTLKGDSRILPFGRFLRKTKINELPQLWNVLIGDMSLVGPRPQAVRCFNAFPEKFRASIIQVKPGLSGIGSIVFRGEEDLLNEGADSLAYYDQIISPYKAEIEAWYVDNRSVLNYFAIIFITLWVVLFPKSGAVWKVFSDIPRPPSLLSEKLNFVFDR